MSKDLKEKLSKDVSAIESYVEERLTAFHKAHGDMSKEMRKNLPQYAKGISKVVRDFLQGCDADMKVSADAWNAIASTLAAKTAPKPAPKPFIEVKERIVTVEEAVNAEEKQPETEEDLAGKVLHFIKAHPSGVRVVDMEESFGVARIKLAMIAKKLSEEGKVRKEENHYHPL